MRAKTLNKAQKQRFLTYLSLIEVGLIQPSHIISISEKKKKQTEQRWRNYKKAIELLRYVVEPVGKERPNLKTTMQYKSPNHDRIYLSRKTKGRPLRKVQERKQPVQVPKIYPQRIYGF